jgi:hypothetical protein
LGTLISSGSALSFLAARLFDLVPPVSLLNNLNDEPLMRVVGGRLLLASLLALYGLVTVCGPALHALPGCDHPGQIQSSEQDPGQGAKPKSLSSSTDDCPICHFHTQGQFLVTSDRDFCIDVVRIQPADEPPIARSSHILNLSIPRAPPLV